MKKIKLTRGMFALVDDQDFKLLNQYKWHYMTVGYAARDIWRDGRNVKILMHRQIMELKKGDGLLVDHINRKMLDNRRSNLRIASKSMNAFNSKLPSSNTSGIRNIGFDNARQKWRYAFKLNGKTYSARYGTKREALIALANKKDELCLSFQ